MLRKQTKTCFVNQDFTCVRTTDVSEEQQEQEEESYINNVHNKRQLNRTYCYYIHVY